MLLLGPTGVGKTHLVRALASLIGVPFVRADATRFSSTGYVGADVEDVVRSLVPAAGGDATMAEFGIVYVDEVDKLAEAEELGGGKGVNTRQVQSSLLKLLEDSEVALTPQPRASHVPAPKGRVLRTRHILFLFSGAFASMERSGAQEGHAITRDFVRAGIEPELIGRIPVRVALRPLSEDELLRVLTDARESVVAQLECDFESYGIELRFSKSALQEVAHRASSQGTGARGLMTVMEEALRHFKFELPSSEIRFLEVSAEMIRQPHQELDRMLRSTCVTKA